MSDCPQQRLELLVLKTLVAYEDAGLVPASTRAMRNSISTRARYVDQALRALQAAQLIDRVEKGWVPGSGARTRLGHAERRRCRSGRQVSYRKAVDVAVEMLVAAGHPREERTRVLAEKWMRDALPEKQRARTRVTDG